MAEAAADKRGEFWRLSPEMRNGIVARLGWRSLRPVQELAIRAVQEGDNAIVLAPTAGGKTEAAMLPVVDGIAAQRIGPVAALLLSPLRALLNNQEERVHLLSSLGGLTAFKWHGDVDATARRRFVDEPAHILMITPESLEVILATSRYDKAALFGALRYVVVDEIHAFAGDDRGDHLAALLERLTEYARADFQRIGLSATVANPETLLVWLQGSSRRAGRVVRPDAERTPRIIEIHPLPDEDQVAARASSIARGRKTLFFTNSRSGCERIRSALSDRGVRAFVHHSSVARSLRDEAEAAFRGDTPACIICTSTMELGLDVGDLDAVLQLDAPNTVSSFMQRLGRTGRRAGTKGHFAFLTDETWSFMQALAVVSLAARGEVECVSPSRRSAHVYLHQVLARVLQHGGLTRGRLVEGVGQPYCFAGLPHREREQIVDQLVAADILTRAGALLIFGERGERAFSAANFRELYAVFDTPRQLVVRTAGNREVGTLDTIFAQSFRERDFVFVLGGRPWEAVEWDWERGVLVVRPASHGKVPSWIGPPRFLSREICEEIRRLLVDQAPLGFIGGHAQRVLDTLRAEWTPLLASARLVVARQGSNVFLYTFAGGRINNVLARAFEISTSTRCVANNLWLRMPVPDSGSLDEPTRALLEFVSRSDAFTDKVNAALVGNLPFGRLSKFQPYLPTGMVERLLLERLFDVPGAVALARETIHVQG